MKKINPDIVTSAQMALAAYDDTISARNGFGPAAASTLDLPGSGTRNSVHFTFSDGIYRATVPGSIGKQFGDKAVADIYTKTDALGHITLAVAFRGTDGIAIDKVLGWGPQMKEAYYPLYKPLINAIKAYVANHDVTDVLVTGHSLGGAMVQYAMNDFIDTAKTKFHGISFGSPGAPDSGSAADNRLLQFEYTDDAFTKLHKVPLIDFDRQGQVIEMPLDDTASSKDDNKGFYEHRMELYLQAVKNFAGLGAAAPAFMTTENHHGNETTRIYAGSTKADSLRGTSQNETLFGGKGNDALWGLAGNDRLAGGAGNDRLNGGDGNDRMAGGSGANWLTGGKGDDTFVFNAKLGNGNVARLTDFTHNDHLLLNDAAFDGLEVGKLSKAQFTIGTEANDSTDRIIYDKASGSLYFDADGTGTTAAIKFAILMNHTSLNFADFEII